MKKLICGLAAILACSCTVFTKQEGWERDLCYQLHSEAKLKAHKEEDKKMIGQLSDGHWCGAYNGSVGDDIEVLEAYLKKD